MGDLQDGEVRKRGTDVSGLGATARQCSCRRPAFVHHLSRLSIAILPVFASALDGPAVFAQRRVRGNLQQAIRQPGARRSAPPASPIVIEATAPIANLLTRADEGLQRGDWKFAIDCLQRVINDPEDSLIPWTAPEAAGAELYESARRTAIRRLASLPPEALGAYRLLYDGKAKRLFELGVANHDAHALRKLIRRYLLSAYGDDATALLMSWALDAGRFDEAVALADDLLALAPDADGVHDQIMARLAAAYALLGQREKSQSMLGSLSAANNGSSTGLEGLSRLRPAVHSQDRAVSVWPTRGGSPARRGWMPGVDPTLSDSVPWWSPLPGATTDAWRPVLVDDLDDPLQLPVGRLVTNGRQVFARTPRGCVALDVEDLAVAWEARTSKRGARRAARDATPMRSAHEIGMAEAGAAFTDEVAGSISLGHGVATIVARAGHSRYTLAHRDAGNRGLLSWIPRPNIMSTTVRGTRIVAYEQDTGQIAWQRGRTGHPDDPLGGVRFLSVPLAVGDHFWVPFTRQDGLHVAVLDPTDGALIRQIPVCSLGSNHAAMQRGLHLAASAGLVFVPSNAGMLFAIDAADHTMRWASRYNALITETVPSRPDATGGWLSSPPIVAGGTVLLTPAGKSELIALSVSDGTLAWTAHCEDLSYPIGADQEYVYLGGRSIACLSLSDGKPIWSTKIDSVPTGRAIRAEDKLYVPTLRELLALNASTGEAESCMPVSLAHGALGNLLSYRSALYSINPSSVRRFPDIGQCYPMALRTLERHPDDIKAAVQLAWLELLRGEPQRAFDVVNAIPPSKLRGGGHRADDAARVRVEALLAMAGRSGTAGKGEVEVLALLEDANRAARRAQDRIRCTLAIADQLEALDRHVDAFDRLWRLSISDDGKEIVSWLDHVDGAARWTMGLRLEQTAEKLTDRELGAFRDAALASLGLTDGPLGTNAATVETRQHLRAVGDLRVLDTVGQRAMLEMGIYYANRRAFEQAEQLLQSSLRVDADQNLSIAAHMGLCVVYGMAHEVDVIPRHLLEDQLDVLLTQFGSRSVPPFADSIGDWGVDGGSARTIAAWAGELRSQFSLRESDDTKAKVVWPANRSRPVADVEFTDEVIWSVQPPSRGEVARLVGFGLETPPALGNRVIIHRPDDVIAAYRATDGELMWQSELRLPGQFSDRQLVRWPEGEDGPRRAVLHGQTAVFGGRDGLFALGVGTGRRLWSKPYEPRERRIGQPINYGAMAAHDGLLAATPRAGRLSLIKMLDGSSVWERDLLGESVAHLWWHDNLVITADPRLERVHVLARDDGRLVTQILFDQPNPQHELVGLIRAHGLILGPFDDGESQGVVAVNLSNGETVWRMPVEKPVSQMFTPQEGFVGLSLLGGDILILDVLTGRLELKRRVNGAHSIARGILVDGTLVVQPRTNQAGVRSTALVALDVATDEQLWRRDDVIPLWRLGRPLRVVNGRLPALVQSDHRRTQGHRNTKLAMLDLRTGLGEEVAVSLRGARTAARLNGDFELMLDAGVAVFGTDGGIRALRMVSPAGTAPGGF